MTAPTDGIPLLEVRSLHIRFPAMKRHFFDRQRFVHAADDVSFTLERGRTLGLVGESGSGKTSVARGVMRLVKPASGDVLLDGESVLPLHGDALSAFRRRVQFIFQDPYSSLNPRSRAGDIIREPMELLNVGPREERGGEVLRLMEAVGLRPDQARLFPHQFSGGQRQRIAIARALASRPELLCCDEPVSALDVAVQAQILNLLRRLQNDLGLSYLFISHDLGVIQYICDDIAVLYLGQIVETGTSESLFANPLHPYTRALLAAVPSADPRRRQEPEALPSGPAASPVDPPPGCRFAPLCPCALDICRCVTPPLVEAAPRKRVACHRHTETGGSR
ncbi:ABC transporter ATP-binding protein [Bilophila wadsworthia]|uniref:ABC transporter ATP-binding protein n=1 Tax=Bilophila wadsworthia TaxID=35833 RepID=UPI0025977E9F|nr:oligopeptide/dipeptide ABC transporter ATP-binding protein [Bilophila wadsworthia]